MILAAAPAPQEPFGGHYVLDSFVRLFIIFVGFTLALVCLKIAYGHFRRREIDRMWGTLAFAFLVATPAVTGVLNFGKPLAWLPSSIYLIGLICGIIGLGYRVALYPPWKRWKKPRLRRQQNGPR